MEAEEDDAPPDMEIPADAPEEDVEAPVDDPAVTEEPMDEDPPDFTDEVGDAPEFSPEEDTGEEASLDINEKISTILNRNLFQRFLSLVNTIRIQISSIKSNSDIIFSSSNIAADVLSGLEKLDENIHYYLSNQFENENYSQNLLFFNKSINLLSLLNEDLDKSISKADNTGGGETSK